MKEQYPSISGIILAAGTSSRFAGNKLVASIDGGSLIGHVLDAALASRLGKIVIVLGHRSHEVKIALGEKLNNERIAVECISDYAQGQSRSVIAGLQAVQAESMAAMYLMGDQPFLNPAIIDSLISAFEESGMAICYPSINGKRRNPVIFGKIFFPDILAIEGDTGARAIIDRNADQAFGVPFDDELPFLDIDTSAEYRKLAGTASG
ncbi:MAG: nucleotidyltransferase family protein [Fimbriimonadaceae bacterium]|nr:nucleotidyltransferase family protein [Alphaproteobacteria bacterium]